MLLDGVVVNVAVWDGVADWNPIEAGVCDSTVDVTGQAIHVGSTYADGAFTPPPTPPPAPDPNGFGTATLADASISMSSRLLVASWIPALGLALQAGNVALISSTWSDLISAYAISSSDQTAIESLATEYGIPGL
jgi:hypothetical protein